MGLNPGSAGFAMPPAEDDFVRAQKDTMRTIRENAAARSLEAASIGKGGITVKDGGSITVEAPGTIDLQSGTFVVANLIATSLVQGAAVYTTGTVTSNGGITSAGVYATDVTALPGPRTSAWVHSSGVLGQTLSSRRFKTNIREAQITVEQVLSIAPKVFEYKSQVEIRENPENPYFDPQYVVPLELGMIAEELVEAGLGQLVHYEDDGVTARGIHYDLFGSIAALVIGRAQQERIQTLEARIEKLEAKA